MPELPKNFKIETLSTGKYTAEDGAILIVKKAGGASWMVRYRFGGRYHDLGLGSLDLIKRRDAAKLARNARAEASMGRDPKAKKIEHRQRNLTFTDAFQDWFADWKRDRNADFAVQLETQMRTYILPQIGNMPINAIKPHDVRRALMANDFWINKPETANRCRQRISRVFKHARVKQTFQGFDPADGVQEGLPSIARKPKHHESLDWWHTPKVFAWLAGRREESTANRLHQFLIVTGLRYGEAKHLRWDHIHRDQDGRPYIDLPDYVAKKDARAVGLNDAAKAILDRMRDFAPDLIFPTTVATKGRARTPIGIPLSTNALYKGRDKVIKELDLPHFVPHGWRSSLRQFCKDKGASFEVCEFVLGHKVGNSVSQAYDRTGYMRETLPYLDLWSDYVTGATDRDNVVALHDDRL